MLLPPQGHPVLINGMSLPLVGKFPIEEHKAKGGAVMDGVGWWKLARLIAKHDLDNLGAIFQIAETKLTAHAAALNAQAGMLVSPPLPTAPPPPSVLPW